VRKWDLNPRHMELNKDTRVRIIKSSLLVQTEHTAFTVISLGISVIIYDFKYCFTKRANRNVKKFIRKSSCTLNLQKLIFFISKKL
jgi:hypothetical protein